MFGMGWPEILLISIVAILVIGPKDMPDALRAAGRFVYKIRKFMRNMQQSLDDITQEAELDDIIKEANAVGADNIDAELEKQAAHRARLATDPDYAEAYQAELERQEQEQMMPLKDALADKVKEDK